MQPCMLFLQDENFFIKYYVGVGSFNQIFYSLDLFVMLF
jgi:hypothetical protein